MDIPTAKGQTNVFFPYIEEIVNAITNSGPARPQLNYTLVSFVENALVAGWIFNIDTDTFEKVY